MGGGGWGCDLAQGLEDEGFEGDVELVGLLDEVVFEVGGGVAG